MSTIDQPASTAAATTRSDATDPAAFRPVVVIAVEARSATERRILRDWAQRTHPGSAVVRDDDPDALGEVLRPDGEQRVVPVRVTWLPELQRRGRGFRPVHFLLLANPRRPPSRLHRLLGDRWSVTVGAPGGTGELRDRFRRSAGAAPDRAFAEFVAHQAAVACDVAERAVVGDGVKVPRKVAEQIAASSRYDERVTRLADEIGMDHDEARAHGESCLAELATVQSPLWIDLYRAFIRPMHAKAWTVVTERERFDRLKELNRKHALVFLPTHRSYVDPAVMQQALDDNGMPPNHLLGGANMAFWPLGPLGRRAGVVFIRRSFGDDRIYKLSIREFFGHLVAKRFNLEWYIEGGRTRTGKLRPPKLGLLRYLADALEDDRAEDVMLVPVSIVYDRLREVGATTAEQTGATKQREGLRWWVGYVRSQATHVGKARVHVGEPFLFRQALEEAGPGPAKLDKVGFRICDAINEASPVTATSLVSLALLGARGRALSFTQIERLTAPLLDYVERRELRGPVAELRTPRGLQRGIDSLVDAGVLSRYDAGTEPVWSIAEGAEHVAAFYRNGVIHHVVNRAIAEVALLRVARADDEATATPDRATVTGWREALAVRDLLKFEFFFAPKPRFGEQLRHELDLIEPDWQGRLSAASAREALDAAPTVLAGRVLRSFVDAQYVVADRLAARDPRREVVRDAFLKECLAVGGQLLRQQRILQPEAVALELFSAALQLAQNRDLVDPGRDEVRERRREWLAEVRALLGDLDELRLMDERRQEVLLRDDRG